MVRKEEAEKGVDRESTVDKDRKGMLPAWLAKMEVEIELAWSALWKAVC